MEASTTPIFASMEVVKAFTEVVEVSMEAVEVVGASTNAPMETPVEKLLEEASITST